MGLDYSYLLYFEREHLWDALQGVVAHAEKHQPPITIHFPDHELLVPLDSYVMKNKKVHYNDPRFGFDTVMLFEEDDVIEEYLWERDIDDQDRSPPSEEGVNRVSIGYIYLDIYNSLAEKYPDNKTEDLVLFEFGTPGTSMSLMFSYSTSIRKTFTELLENYHGVCGVFNREAGGGELFWWKGQRMSEDIGDPFKLPDEIEALLKLSGKYGGVND